MKFRITTLKASILSLYMLTGCQPASEPLVHSPAQDTSPTAQATTSQPQLLIDEARLNIYYPVDLIADLDHLSDNQKEMIGLLIDASEIMDDLFWQQAFGEDKEAFLAKLTDPRVKHFASINYGPWDRLNADKPFLAGYEAKSSGAQFYPADITKDELLNSSLGDKTGLYSVIERAENGELVAIPYHQKYATKLQQAASLLRQAAGLAEDPDFSNYLLLRADAFLSNQYQLSDLAWMDVKNNQIDVVIGPIETYEDQLLGARTSFESYVLIKDMAWSEKLAQFAQYLPELQRGLPVAEAYKAQMPGTNADLNAYDVIYYAGHSNAGSKTIAINLPNDEEVQLAKGTRRLQLKNAMRAKFDHILLPIADVLIVPEQRQHITFNAFFANTMFHEVAHGLGIKNVLNSDTTVREALQEHASALEEGKADILGLYMVEQLLEREVISEGVLEDYYVTFMAGIFRSIRFGASSAHGKANMVRFNYFAEKGAFTRNELGQYAVDMPKMREAVNTLSNLILTLQGDGNYAGVASLVAAKGVIGTQLQADLSRLTDANISVDIHFNQGKDILGLAK
ncbi:Zn-dependent hydrolase [Alteromonas sp. LMIT006]|uniref:dipeptidyl-peptidase 3 family protein n=1 Tax=Alteromonadaceae TaxID=72275 RepID=UPI0020CA31CF|nr:Zn-dependent hydrolase [Alteromonas sp. LMIT006]UTP72473.1 Zn-dependent hydrolase [Alteromonas sp. LMIT006]